MQHKLKLELGIDGSMDYGLIICQVNGRPIMTEHLNKRFKEILEAMDDPEMEANFYQRNGQTDKPQKEAPANTTTIDASALASILVSNPEMLTQVLQYIRSANKG